MKNKLLIFLLAFTLGLNAQRQADAILVGNSFFSAPGVPPSSNSVLTFDDTSFINENTSTPKPNTSLVAIRRNTPQRISPTLVVRRISSLSPVRGSVGNRIRSLSSPINTGLSHSLDDNDTRSWRSYNSNGALSEYDDASSNGRLDRGKHSYNHGAGLYRISNFAGYVRYNMPLGATYERPQLTDEEAWDLAAFVNSQPRPTKDLNKDWPNIAGKPFDHPFGPYADPFSEQQHKYGPYKPIKEWKEAHKKPSNSK
jgi:hypothetical protein